MSASSASPAAGLVAVESLLHFTIHNFLLLFVILLLDRLVRATVVAKAPPDNADLKKAYEIARPALPEPNEVIDIAKLTGVKIEEIYQWMRSARAYERSMAVAERLHDALVRFVMLTGCYLTVFAAQNDLITAEQARMLRISLQFQLLVLHGLSYRSSIPVSEFALMGVEQLVNMSIALLCDVSISELVTLTHDSVASVFELAKVVELASKRNISLATRIFVAYFLLVVSVRMFQFVQGLGSLGFFRPLEPSGAFNPVSMLLVWLLVAFDIKSTVAIVKAMYWGFWATDVKKRTNRADSISSNTSFEYESDSSLSSNLRMNFDKDD